MQKNDNTIFVIGANPAWQKTLTFNELIVGEVNRAENVDCFHSGKGINFCRVNNFWNKFPSRLFQFAGGDTGKSICTGLNEEKINHTTIPVDSSTRVCTTCLCKKTGVMTELIEPSSPLNEQQLALMFNAVEKDIHKCIGLAICGTIPQGTDIEIYIKIALLANKHNIPLLIDSWQNIQPVLKISQNTILKINYSELKHITGEMSPEKAITKIINQYQLKSVAITNSASSAFLGTDSGIWEFMLPRLDSVVNPLGSGDTVAAIFFNEYLSGTGLPKAFAYGLAAASASCLTTRCGYFERTVMNEIYQQINILKSGE